MAHDEDTLAMEPQIWRKETGFQRRQDSVPTKIVKHANDADEAMKAFEGQDGEVLALDEVTSKRLKRIDYHVMLISNVFPRPRRLGADAIRSCYASSTD